MPDAEGPGDLRRGLPVLGATPDLESVPVFCWHGVAPGLMPSPTRVTPATFGRQLDGLAAAGARPLTLAEFDAAGGKRPVGSRECLLVFDDGYASVLEHAYPALAARGWTAAAFPVLGFIGRTASWDPAQRLGRCRHLDHKELGFLLEAGWQVGLHGRTHCPLDRCGLARLDTELVTARAELELELGILVKVISWPWGLSDRRARRLAEAAGLHLGLGRHGSNDPMDRPRRMVYASHGPADLARMLAGAPPDLRQRAAAWGASLSAELARRTDRRMRS
jgi:peptidoglycan/xylan/chitin deacetylase (PgdA/CDA1 family)